MGRKKQKKSKKTNKKKTRVTKKRQHFEIALSSETLKETIGITLIILGLFFLFSLLKMAGNWGNYLGIGLKEGFGSVVAYLISFAFIGLGAAFFKFEIKSFNLIGLILFFFSFSSFIELIGGEKAGGLVGIFFGETFKFLIGFWLSLILFFGLSLISLLITFNTSFKTFKSLLEKRKEEEKEIKKERKIEVPSIAVKTLKSSKETLKSRPLPLKPKKITQKISEEEEGKIELDKEWKYPSLDLLEDETTKLDAGNLKANSEIIKRTLANFGIEVEMGEINVGPTVTQYTLRPAEGIKLTRITSLANDLALALAAHPLRIEAPIPGKSLVGIEVPNKGVELVRIKEILSSPQFAQLSSRSKLVLALGKDVSGTPVVANLATMPHLLIAGATGSGKSVCINALILSFLYQNSPKDLRFILVDPKRVELTGYNGIPHLLTPVIVDTDKTLNALRWANLEMEKRYRLFAEIGARNISVYNRKVKDPTQILPRIVIIIDELADVMAHAAREAEGLIVRIAQMARATGIHLVIATQRPSVNVVTGLIKANIATRIAFMVASQIDSRTIIDMAGAEKLLGKGDMLFLPGDGTKPRRIQGTYVSDEEVKKVTDFVKNQREPEYEEDVTAPSKLTISSGLKFSEDADDELYEEAYDIVVKAGKASTSLLQRRLRIGYARAARLMDLLEERGVIGPPDGAKPREVLIEKDSEFENFDEENEDNFKEDINNQEF